jgi:hypothetical protein
MRHLVIAFPDEPEHVQVAGVRGSVRRRGAALKFVEDANRESYDTSGGDVGKTVLFVRMRGRIGIAMGSLA